MQAFEWQVAELIAHSGDKILLDEVLEYNHEALVARARVKSDSVYLRGGAEPPWLGLEYMAQAVAAFAGLRRRHEGGEPIVGMLIGTRKYRCNLPQLPVGLHMTIAVKALLEDNEGLSVFQCRLQGLADEESLIAEANLNVYQPQDIDTYLQTKNKAV